MHSITVYSKSITALPPAPSRLPALIAEFQRLTAALDAIDHCDDPLGWDEVATARCRALEALLDERPKSIAEFSAKFEALIEFTEEDTELVVLNVLAEDVRVLAEA
jgi:hypothetical protein